MSSRQEIDLTNVISGGRNRKRSAKALEALDWYNSTVQNKKRKNPVSSTPDSPTPDSPTPDSPTPDSPTPDSLTCNPAQGRNTASTDAPETSSNPNANSDDLDKFYAWRKNLVGRPTKDCAADYPKWKKSKSPIYTFLILLPHTIQYNALGQLKWCVLRCSPCKDKGVNQTWTWKTSGGGSTSNFNGHFETEHTQIWKRALEAEWEGTGKKPAGLVTESGQTTLPFAAVCLHSSN
ncbi:uncharacterized protein EI90DRAFT_839929 [Cantharellus anzutake]|uniref:uncharacterized protein n=1 Tax=Cantharellus anzutake TaxID=1750568 RepID=UPI0019052987|nr:uncharacterized protein EI90DRAFT_839929 [Cantharellus anzutake]KAF8332244.1 hypothetical protein EI90DRAFT_839929 [Cantharellus anzutake]